MRWNHRLILHQHPRGDWIGLHEVYYDDNGAVDSYTTDPVRFTSDFEGGDVAAMTDDIARSLRMALADIGRHPVLRAADLPDQSPSSRYKVGDLLLRRNAETKETMRWKVLAIHTGRNAAANLVALMAWDHNAAEVDGVEPDRLLVPEPFLLDTEVEAASDAESISEGDADT